MRFRLLAACLLAATVADAAAFQPDLRDVGTLPLHVTPTAAVQKALAAPRKDEPFQFAVSVPFALGLADGRWQALDSDTLSWRTRIRSYGARSLNLEFARFRVPAGASLWLYDPAGNLVQGPYTAANHNDARQLWTAIVPGEDLVLELRVPAAAVAQLDLQVGKVNHAFADFDGTKSHDPNNDAGACNINVTCPAGVPWSDEIRSVARAQIGGTALCTGQLVNNLRFAGTPSERQPPAPLFLTANHCGLSAANQNSLVVYWNYRNASCTGEHSGSLSQNQTGSTFLARDLKSDFSLARLASEPAGQFNVYYAGWNATGQVPQCGVSIHHPQGQEKRIAGYTDAADAVSTNLGDNGGPLYDTWRVVWSAGTTEVGSSGGGLWDERRYLVGVLTGGGASCDDPQEPDFFGRLARGWTASTSASGQLKAHLDPSDTGCLRLPGQDPGDAPPACDTGTIPPAFDCGGGDGGTDGGGSDDGGGGALGLLALPLGLLFLPLAVLRRRRR